MKLHDEWRWIVTHAWSFRFTVAAFMLTIVEAFLSLIAKTNHLPPEVFFPLSALITGAAFVSRLFAQAHPGDLRNDT